LFGCKEKVGENDVSKGVRREKNAMNKIYLYIVWYKRNRKESNVDFFFQKEC